jgi:hypothetical protein
VSRHSSPIAHKLCVAGYGQRISLWLSIYRGQLTEATIETPKGHEHIKIEERFADLFLFEPVNPKNGPKTTKTCQYLTLTAGKKASSAIRDYAVKELAMALISHYGWQIANGAKVLPEKGELAKVYADEFAVYFFGAPMDRELAQQRPRAAAKR